MSGKRSTAFWATAPADIQANYQLRPILPYLLTGSEVPVSRPTSFGGSQSPRLVSGCLNTTRGAGLSSFLQVSWAHAKQDVCLGICLSP